MKAHSRQPSGVTAVLGQALLSSARGAWYTGLALGTMAFWLGAFTTFVPRDDWLSRLVGSQTAAHVRLTAAGATFGACVGGLSFGAIATASATLRLWREHR